LKKYKKKISTEEGIRSWKNMHVGTKLGMNSRQLNVSLSVNLVVMSAHLEFGGMGNQIRCKKQ
jgi:hypothetical protein